MSEPESIPLSTVATEQLIHLVRSSAATVEQQKAIVRATILVIRTLQDETGGAP